MIEAFSKNPLLQCFVAILLAFLFTWRHIPSDTKLIVKRYLASSILAVQVLSIVATVMYWMQAGDVSSIHQVPFIPILFFPLTLVAMALFGLWIVVKSDWIWNLAIAFGSLHWLLRALDFPVFNLN